MVYFGRCLRAFICIVEWLALRAALTGEALVFVFELLVAVFSFMLIVHIYGAIKKDSVYYRNAGKHIVGGVAIVNAGLFPNSHP